MDETRSSRAQWGSKFGFLMAAIGSAVGLGNIWGFPFKMGQNGGFAFLLVYLVLAVFVGYIIMNSELALGRRTGKGIIGAYHTASRRFRWVGMLGVISPFLILMFYCVLGANGLWVPFQNTLGIVGEFNDCWLDFLDCIAEGLAMPLGALFMSIMIGWELKPSYVLEEIGQTRISRFYSFCIRFVCPATMLLVLAGQLDNFFKLGWFK